MGVMDAYTTNFQVGELLDIAALQGKEYDAGLSSVWQACWWRILT